MDIVYYFDEETACCPVKKYLEVFNPDPQDSEKTTDRKMSLLLMIRSKLEHLARNNGDPATANFAGQLRKYGFSEIKQRKDENILIRITYFRHAKKMVLLHAFEKPDNYDTQRARNKVDKEFQRTNRFKEKFTKKPTSYEPYE